MPLYPKERCYYCLNWGVKASIGLKVYSKRHAGLGVITHISPDPKALYQLHVIWDGPVWCGSNEEDCREGELRYTTCPHRKSNCYNPKGFKHDS